MAWRESVFGNRRCLGPSRLTVTKRAEFHHNALFYNVCPPTPQQGSYLGCKHVRIFFFIVQMQFDSIQLYKANRICVGHGLQKKLRQRNPCRSTSFKGSDSEHFPISILGASSDEEPPEFCTSAKLGTYLEWALVSA